MEPLEAKVHAFLFGAKLVVARDFRDATMLIDNRVLASVVLARLQRTTVQDIKQARSYLVIKLYIQINK